MIQKQIDAIAKGDIDALVTGQVREARTIEYKRALPGNSDSDKREFLGDVSSFANAAGGDILYGVSETEGVPQAASGLTDINVDAEILRLESIIRDGLDPRIPGIHTRAIDGFEKGPVLVLRVPKSWASPHLVKFGNLSRFYTRSSNGRHQMDTAEIRAAFTLSDALPDRIRRFRDDRLAKIVADETPILLQAGAKLVLHICPLVSFSSEFRLGSSELAEHRMKFRPMACMGWSGRFNLDGIATYPGPSSISDRTQTYCQLFRSGIVEAVWADFVSRKSGGAGSYIASIGYEEIVIESTKCYLDELKALNVPLPLLLIMSMVGVKGVYMGVGSWRCDREPMPIDRDTLILPEVLLEEYGLDVARSLRPIFDAVWNACGYTCSGNYDAEGNWGVRGT